MSRPVRPWSDAALIAWMSLAEILCMVGFATAPALLPSLQAEWDLSSTGAGLISGGLFLGYVLAVTNLSALTDRTDARRVYLVSVLVAGAGSLFFALLATGLVSAVVAQVVFGIGFAGVYMPGLKALCDRIDPRHHSRAATYYTSLASLGLAGSYLVSGWLAATVGWRWAFVGAALATLGAWAIAFFVLAPRPPVSVAARPSALAAMRQVWHLRATRLFIIGAGANTWEIYGLRAWLIAFLFYASREDASSTWLGGPSVLAGIVAVVGMAASIVGNELAGRFDRGHLISLAMAGAPLLGLALAAAPSEAAVLVPVLACAHYALVMADTGLIYGGTVIVTPAAQRGAALGLSSLASFLAGVVAPVAFGLALDLAGGQGSMLAWIAAFVVLGAPCLGSALLFLIQPLRAADSTAAKDASA